MHMGVFDVKDSPRVRAQEFVQLWLGFATNAHPSVVSCVQQPAEDMEGKDGLACPLCGGIGGDNKN
jgi:hypothetical protein